MAKRKHKAAIRAIAADLSAMRKPQREYAEELRKTLARVSATLVMCQGKAAAAEALYRLADAVVDGPQP